ncbi:MAG TPA: hypothetical protein VJ124_17170 [Pyrinomonadaceae bacterium]|nr:hypothetical protein [Pyrinomonadaceae bacterium]
MITVRLIASRDGREGSVVMHQDDSVYAAQLEREDEVTHELTVGRHGWVQIVSAYFHKQFQLVGRVRKEGLAMEATRVTVDELRERMDRGERLSYVDTRNPKAWAAAETKLLEAIRVPADEVQKHLAEIPRDRTVITYCT